MNKPQNYNVFSTHFLVPKFHVLPGLRDEIALNFRRKFLSLAISEAVSKQSIHILSSF